MWDRSHSRGSDPAGLPDSSPLSPPRHRLSRGVCLTRLRLRSVVLASVLLVFAVPTRLLKLSQFSRPWLSLEPLLHSPQAVCIQLACGVCFSRGRCLQALTVETVGAGCKSSGAARASGIPSEPPSLTLSSQGVRVPPPKAYSYSGVCFSVLPSVDLTRRLLAMACPSCLGLSATGQQLPSL